MAKPTINKPEWATAEAVGGGDVTEPVTRKTTGFQIVGGKPEKPTYEELNFLFKSITDWVAYLETATDEIGAIQPDFFVEAGSSAADVYVLDKINALQDPTSYVDGMRVRFRVTNANTGASTINVNGIGVKTIEVAGIALNSGMLPVGFLPELIFDLANDVFILIETPWVDYTTTLSGESSMTFTSITRGDTKYLIRNRMLTLHIKDVQGTVGGTPSAGLLGTFPTGITGFTDANWTESAWVTDPSQVVGQIGAGASGFFRASKSAAANFSAGSSRGFSFSVIGEI